MAAERPTCLGVWFEIAGCITAQNHKMSLADRIFSHCQLAYSLHMFATHQRPPKNIEVAS